MSVAHKQAVKDLFAGFPHTLYDGQVPDKPSFPYAVLYMDTGVGRVTKLCARTDLSTYRFQVTSVGLSDESARIVADAARARVLDVRLTVAGQSCNPIRHETSIPLRPDTDVTIPDSNLHPMYAVDTYRIPSHAD